MDLLKEEARELIRRALREDAPEGDVTSALLIPEGQHSSARIIAKQDCVVAGLPFARDVFHEVDAGVEFRDEAADGARVAPGGVLATIRGGTRPLLLAERTALNILQRLTGTATLTAEFVRRIEGTGARLLDTRKTTPGMRRMQKYAVRMGGGYNHRFNLSDGILIKDNHIRAAGGVGRAVALALAGRPAGMAVEAECETLDEVREAVLSGADIVMLDNMGIEEIREAVEAVSGRARIEVSGGVSLATVRAIAETGVDFISVGALTHSAPAADLSMEMD